LSIADHGGLHRHVAAVYRRTGPQRAAVVAIPSPAPRALRLFLAHTYRWVQRRAPRHPCRARRLGRATRSTPP
jgi:hypothetical protein